MTAESNTPDAGGQDTPQEAPAPEQAGTAAGDVSLDDLIQSIPDDGSTAPVDTHTPEAPAEPDTPQDGAEQGGEPNAEPKDPAPTDPTKDDPGDPFEARYKNAQAWATRVAQENADLKQRLTRLESAVPSKDDAPKESKSESAPAFDQAKFDELEATEGLGKALEYRDSVMRQQIIADVESRSEKKQRQEQFASEAKRLFAENGVTESDFAEMQALQQQEVDQGFAPSPGALLVRQQTGGYDNALKLINFAKAELRRRQAAGAGPSNEGRQDGGGGARAPHPGVPGGASRRSSRQARPGQDMQAMTLQEFMNG
jgi:hypothetical protein